MQADHTVPIPIYILGLPKPELGAVIRHLILLDAARRGYSSLYNLDWKLHIGIYSAVRYRFTFNFVQETDIAILVPNLNALKVVQPDDETHPPPAKKPLLFFGPDGYGHPEPRGGEEEEDRDGEEKQH